MARGPGHVRGRYAVQLAGTYGPGQEGARRVSRYEFTDSNGYRVGGVIEARTAAEARTAVIGRTGHTGRLHCTHLSDDHSTQGMDAIFFLGPDAVEY